VRPAGRCPLRHDVPPQAGGRFRVLFLMDETFRGWNARTAWRNTCLDLHHRRDFDKVAIVGAPTWEQWCAKLVDVLTAGEIRISPATS
jgi:hypothetical protein